MTVCANLDRVDTDRRARLLARGWRASLAVLALSIAACTSRQSPAPSGSSGYSPPTAQSRPAVTPPITVTPSPLGPRSTRVVSGRGAPHVSAIEHVVLAIDRQAALTQGRVGDIRLWTALDGGVEPVAVPVQGAHGLALASHAQGWRIAIVDTAGGAQLWHYHARNGFSQLFAMAPHRGYRQLVLAPGGTHVIALLRDHSLSVLAADGRVLASLQVRGFRPMRLFATGDPRSLVAVSTRPVAVERKPSFGLTDDLPSATTEEAPSSHDLVVATVRVGASAAPSLSLSARIEIRVADILGAPKVALSSDGRQVAFAQFTSSDAQSAEPHINLYAADLPAGATRLLAKKLPTGRDADFGFIDAHTLVVSGGSEGLAWRIDTTRTSDDSRDAHARTRAIASGTGSNMGGQPHAFGHGLHATGIMRWLHIQRVATNTGRYLGYRGFMPSDAAFSPSGRQLLWIDGNNVAYVEPLADPSQPVATVTGLGPGRITSGAFIDEQHLALLDNTGRISLVAYRSGAVRASTDGGGTMAQRLFYDRESGFLRVTRRARDVWLYRVTAAADAESVFSGPYIIRTDKSLRSSGALRDAGSAVLWTLDQELTYRTYSADEIRAPLSYRAMLERGHKIPGRSWQASVSSAAQPPLAIDSTGRRYYSERARLAILPPRAIDAKTRSPAPIEVVLRVSEVSRLLPGPESRRFAIVGGANNVQVYPRDGSQMLWSYTVADAINRLVWSADGGALALVTVSGGVVLDAETGQPIHRACGPWFEARVAPPLLSSAGNVASPTCGP